MEQGVDEKMCIKCKEIKQISKFSLNRNEKDGHSRYCKVCASAMMKPSNQQILYQRVVKRSNYVCAICGSTEKIYVHHKTPRTCGGDTTEENLIALCYDCHKGAHNGSFSGCHGYVEILDCGNCHHRWYKRREEFPAICPKCKSLHWNKDAINGV